MCIVNERINDGNLKRLRSWIYCLRSWLLQAPSLRIKLSLGIYRCGCSKTLPDLHTSWRISFDDARALIDCFCVSSGCFNNMSNPAWLQADNGAVKRRKKRARVAKGERKEHSRLIWQLDHNGKGAGREGKTCSFSSEHLITSERWAAAAGDA